MFVVTAVTTKLVVTAVIAKLVLSAVTTEDGSDLVLVQLKAISNWYSHSYVKVKN